VLQLDLIPLLPPQRHIAREGDRVALEGFVDPLSLAAAFESRIGLACAIGFSWLGTMASLPLTIGLQRM
jgi:hypothetical protein